MRVLCLFEIIEWYCSRLGTCVERAIFVSILTISKLKWRVALPVVQFNVHKKGKRGVTVFYNCKLHNFVSGSRVYTFMQITLYHFINQLWPAFANQRAREVSFHCVKRHLSPMRWALSTTWRGGTTFYFIFFFGGGGHDHDFKTVYRRILLLSLPRSLLSNDVRCIQLCTTSLREDIELQCRPWYTAFGYISGLLLKRLGSIFH